MKNKDRWLVIDEESGKTLQRKKTFNQACKGATAERRTGKTVRIVQTGNW